VGMFRHIQPKLKIVHDARRQRVLEVTEPGASATRCTTKPGVCPPPKLTSSIASVCLGAILRRATARTAAALTPRRPGLRRRRYRARRAAGVAASLLQRFTTFRSALIVRLQQRAE
jgi:hypothetical protein